MTRKEIAIPPRPAQGAFVPENATEIRVDADLIIPGRGDPIENGTLISSVHKTTGGTGKILYVGPQCDVPSKYSGLKASATVPVVMPGLWDCHVHFFGEAEPSFDREWESP